MFLNFVRHKKKIKKNKIKYAAFVKINEAKIKKRKLNFIFVCKKKCLPIGKPLCTEVNVNKIAQV